MVEPSERREPRFVYLCDAPPLTDGTSSAGRFGWRLDAANHRPLARAVALAESVTLCRAAATQVRSLIAETVTQVSAGAARGLWTWRLELDGSTIAVSAHAYLRRVECTRAHAQFLAALAVADPADGVVRHFGPRALRIFQLDEVPAP